MHFIYPIDFKVNLFFIKSEKLQVILTDFKEISHFSFIINYISFSITLYHTFVVLKAFLKPSNLLSFPVQNNLKSESILSMKAMSPVAPVLLICFQRRDIIKFQDQINPVLEWSYRGFVV